VTEGTEQRRRDY